MDSTKRLVRHFLSLTVLTLLIATVVAGTSENMHAQMFKLGAYLWDDYFILRGEQPRPQCDPNPDIEQRLDQLEREFAQENADYDLFAESFDRESVRISLVNRARVCERKYHDAEIYKAHANNWVKLFSAIEHTFSNISMFSIAQQKTVLITLLMITAIFATWRKEHIAFRAIKTRLDHYLSNIGQMLASACLSVSTMAFFVGAYKADSKVSSPELMFILMIGSAALACINLYQLLNPIERLEQGVNLPKALLTLPIHTWMLLAAAVHFFLMEEHLPGIAIYFTQIFQLTNLHLSIGLYIWVGMLLKETLLGTKLFDVFKPWQLPPEILAFVAIVLMAVPTAYTGASGIIIIAMGAVVYQELRRVGTRRQLALAVTAMTGSSGVVLRPCLLVVGIAILNKQVVTDQLFHWGAYVFMLTLAVFFFFAMLTRKDPLKITPFRDAIGPSLRQTKPLLPYVSILLLIMLVYAVFLNAYLDEFSAPTILPVIIIAFIIFERRFSRDFPERNKVAGASPTIPGAFMSATNRTSVQIGALLMLMACSFTVGGILERGGGGFGLPETFDSVFAAMALMLLFLVFIGMIMDPFGALILVSGTIAPIAYNQGIEPIHFWMTCLVAFELGYLSPPVSLNHLLTRQVVGDKEVTLAAAEGDTFYYRHEKIILPLLVMSTTLIIVAFGPLFFY